MNYNHRKTQNVVPWFAALTLFILLTAFRFTEIDFLTPPKIDTKDVPLTGNTEQLKNFFRNLKNSKNRVARIAHYGDSSLLGDVISEHLRKIFQEKFGGEGIGLVAVGASDITMRESIIQKYSDDWETTSLFLRNPNKLPFGVSGYVTTPSEGSWVKFQTTNFISNFKDFRRAVLFYSNANANSKVEVSLDGKNKKVLNLSTGNTVQAIELFTQNVESVELKFISCKNMLVYGVSFENGNGVYLDNFPITGNTGANLLDITDKMLEESKKHLDYNLIILHYGMNLPTIKAGTLKIYKDKMLKVIGKYKKIFPEAGIVMVGISDRIMKKGNQVITLKETRPIIEAQMEIANEGGVAFWNLFEAMGGENSMEKWVDSAPPLALKDYKHFTHKGGELVAEMFFKAIMGADK